jgi:O-antigen biosynthesis protein
MKVSVIILSYNHWPVTKACLDSLVQLTEAELEIIVIDNGSDAETVQAIKEYPGIHVRLNAENKGFPAGCNQGYEMSTGDFIWFLNNDTIVPSGALTRMLRELENPHTGIVGPVSNRIHGQQQITVDYPFENKKIPDAADVEEFAHRRAAEYDGQSYTTLRMVGFSMLMRRSLLQEMGGFDEAFGYGTFEDDDISMRSVAFGYVNRIALDAFIHHLGGTTSSEIIVGPGPEQGRRNQVHASMKWELNIPPDTMVNPNLLKSLPEIPAGSRILHVNCMAGALGSLLQQQGCRVVGLEAQKREHPLADKHYDGYQILTDAGVDWTYFRSYFDGIIMERQLSHKDFLQVWNIVRPYVKHGAWIAAHVPQVLDQEKGLTYWDNWSGHRHIPTLGLFDVAVIEAAATETGMVYEERKIIDSQMGFFARNALARCRESFPDETKMDKFHEMILRFKY